jgi:hypothetical protein
MRTAGAHGRPEPSAPAHRPPLVKDLLDELARSESATLYAIDEDEYDVGLYRTVRMDLTQLLGKLQSGDGVYGKITLDRNGAVAAAKAIDASADDRWGGVQCFYPRHVLVMRGKKHQMAAVLCFECQYLVVFDEKSNMTTGLCDITHLEAKWYEAFQSAGISTSSPQKETMCGPQE